jgi:hypothetical protein
MSGSCRRITQTCSLQPRTGSVRSARVPLGVSRSLQRVTSSDPFAVAAPQTRL